MHEKTVDLQQTPTNLEDLLSLIRAGTEIILTEGVTPLARVVPITSSSMPRVAGLHAGAIWVSDDFDEELPEPFWTGTA
jgi:antitoxin (DNA-binding transcriptional repressor) of toxin-antitoxin stability system